MKSKLFLILGVSVLFACSCDTDPEPGSLKLNFEMVQDGEPIALNEEFVNENVPTVRVELLKFYLSNVQIQNDAALTDVEVVDFKEGRTSLTFSDLEAGTYPGLTFDVGLNPDQNGSNPVDFAIGHPLSASWGMYWSWAQKYRFVILEGRGASDGVIDGSSTDFIIAFHPGMDGWNQLVELNKGFTIQEGKTSTVTIQIDVDDVFNGPAGEMDLNVDHVSHTTPTDRDIALQFIENFAAAFAMK